jgi:pimeloyl-ACP methyl ester carboxylesterase
VEVRISKMIQTVTVRKNISYKLVFGWAVLFINLYTGKVFAQTSIDTSMAVSIGGIRQWINISSNDTSKPLLLFLSGGPGDSDMDNKDRFTKELQKQFIVVIWDQRESGRTLQLNASPEPLTIDRYQKDTHELITYLLHHFHRPKLYLTGFSWGTVLGLKVAYQDPELLYAYISVSQLVHQNKSEQLLLERSKEQATAKGNQNALAELSLVSVPFESKDQLYYQRKWLFTFSKIPVSSSALRKAFDKFSDSMFILFREAGNIDFTEQVQALQCPIYFFVGRNDYQTNHELTYSYYQQLKAENKHFYWFEKSAHLVPYTESELFQQTIIDIVLPETFK